MEEISFKIADCDLKRWRLRCSALAPRRDGGRVSLVDPLSTLTKDRFRDATLARGRASELANLGQLPPDNPSAVIRGMGLIRVKPQNLLLVSYVLPKKNDSKNRC